jgi:pescadillo protein
MGATVYYDDSNGPEQNASNSASNNDSHNNKRIQVSEDDPSITHQIVDRPAVNRMFVGREYMQPQWAFDSLNNGHLLDMSLYRVGTELPAHLSPFATGHEDEPEDDGSADEEGQDEESTKENTLSNLPESQAKKNKAQEKSKKNKKANKELAVAMLSKKRQKLYQKMQFSRMKRAEEKNALDAKRSQLSMSSSKAPDARKDTHV